MWLAVVNDLLAGGGKAILIDSDMFRVAGYRDRVAASSAFAGGGRGSSALSGRLGVVCGAAANSSVMSRQRAPDWLRWGSETVSDSTIRAQRTTGDP